METDKNPMPRMDLFPRLTKVGAFLGRLVSFLPKEAPLYMSEHYRPGDGASAFLDHQLYDNPDQLQIDFESQSDKGW